MKKQKTRMKSETLDTVERERERERERESYSLNEKKRISKLLNERSGITMVALVVTIVVLLILASISIQGITRTGIFRAAEDTKLEHKRAAIATTLQTKLKINQTEQIRGTDEEIIRETYEDVKNDLEEIKKAGGKDIEVSEVTSEEKDGKTEWFFEVKVDGDVYKVGLDGSDYLGKEDELSPVIQIKVVKTTTNTIAVTATTRRNEGGKIEYYIKEKGSTNFNLVETTDQNEFTYTKLKQDTTFVVKAVAIGKNGQKKASNELEAKTSIVPKLDSNDIKFAAKPDTWTKESVEVTATLNVNGQTFSLATSKNTTTDWVTSNRQIFTSNGTMYAALTDGNNYGITASYEVTNIDKEKPEIKSITATTNTIKITATDNASGIKSYAISESSQTPTKFTIVDNTKLLNKIIENVKQSTKYYVWVKDEAGNISNAAEVTTATVPKLTNANTTITKTPSDWTNQSVTAKAETTEKGYSLQTKKDNGEWQNTDTQNYTENGTIYARLWDGTNAGEETYANITNIDKAAPTSTGAEIKNVTAAGYDVYVYGVKDAGSGVNRVQFPTWTEANGQDDIQGSWQTSTAAKGTKQQDGTTWVYHVNITDHKTEVGVYNTHVYAYDNLGNGKYIFGQQITVPKVKITYDENYIANGETESKKQTVEKIYNTELGTLSTPTRTGYTFVGWFTEKSGGTQISGTTKTPVSDTTYYAHWTANQLNFANQTITKTFSTNAQTANITAASNGTGSYTYTEKTETNASGTATNYISINGTTINIAANTPAGTYTYVITATDNGSKVTKDATYTIKIERAKTATAAAANKTYNGANQPGVAGTNVTWTGTTSAIDAGTYTATATPDGNHAWSDGTTNAKAITWKINPKSVAVTWGTTTTFTYNGNAQAPTAAATSGVANETINVTRTTETNAGSYTSTASISSVTGGRARKENYTLTGNTKAFTINKASVATPANLSVSTAGIVTWSGATNATSYEISINGSNWTAATSGVNYLSTIIGATGNRTVYVRAINKDSNNYATPSGNATKAVAVYALTINSNSTTMGTVDTASYNVISGATYTTSGNKLTIKGITTGTTTSDLKTITATNKTGYTFSSWSSTSGKIDAKKTVTATFTANPINFANQTITKTFSTGAQTAGITGASNGTGSYTYTEKSEKNASGTATNYISISGTTINIAANTPAGTYTYVITATDNGSKVTKDATYTITIGKAAATNPTLSNTTLTYNGAAQYVTVSGGYGGTIYYRTSTNNSSWGSWTTTKPSLTDVGTIYVQAYVAGDGNHNNTGATGSVTLRMNPKSVAVTWGITTTFNYNGGAQAPTAAATSGVSGETINVTRTTATNAGSYTSTASISSVSGGRANKSNYTLSGNTKAFTINKVSAGNPTLSNTTVTYNGTAQYVTVSGGYGGTIYYRTSTNNSSWGSWTTTKPSLTDVGTIYVQAYVAGDGNHNNTGTTGSVTLRMNPKSVAVTWGTTTFTYNGNAQAPTATATSGVNGETINVTRTTATNAGSYTSTASISSVSGGRAKAGNYTLTGTTKAFTINPSSTAIKVYYPTSATGVGSKKVYRNKCSSSSTVLSTTNTGTSNNVLASTYNGLYGSFGGYATTVNTTARATTAITGIATRTETTYYIVTTGSNTSSITATFNYYNGSAWTSTTKAGTRTNNYTYYCTSTTASKTATSYSHGSIAAPSTSTGPYSTAYVGWSTGSKSMSTTSVTTANTTYYAVYRSNVTVRVVTGPSSANMITKTIYRNSMKDGTVLSESNTGTSNLTTISGAYNYAGLATSSGTGTITAITTCAASTTNTFYTVGITKSNATITVTYKYQNGSNDTTATGTKTTTTKYYINSANQVSSTTTVSSPLFTMPKPTRTGYEMDGWNTSSTATTATYTAGQKVSIGNSTTLYAIWYQCAAKINTTYYRTVQKAIDSVATSTSTSTTVTVLKNVTENITILENKIIALNLNEKTIKGDVSNKGTLNIYGGTVDGKSAKKSNCIANIGTLTVTNGTYSGKDQGIYNYSGTTTVKGGTISGGNWGIYGDGMIIVSGGNSTGSSYAGIGTCQGTLKITGGSFTGGYNGIRVWDNNANATIEITNGTFTGKTDSGLLVKKTKATISGGTYDGKDGTDGGYFEQCNAEIKGGTFTGKNYGLKNINGTFTITGGKFRGNTEDGFFNEKGTSYINGGYFTGYKWGINSPSGKIWYHRTDAQYSDNKYVSSQGWSAVTASDLSFY